MESNRRNDNNKQNHIIINNQYVLTRFHKKVHQFNIYHAFDFKTKIHVLAFVHPLKQSFIQPKLSENMRNHKQIHNGLGNNITCSILWSGEVLIDKRTYKVEITQKPGPSLQSVYEALNYKLPYSTIYQLIYNILKIIQKLAEFQIVYRNIQFSKIYLSKNPQQIDLFFIEFFDSKKIGTKGPKISNKYSSIGTHLGLSKQLFYIDASLKDDLQSLSYMIFDLFCENTFFQEKIMNNIEDLVNKKLELKVINNPSIPQDCIDFYYYVRNLSKTQQPNYQYWKRIFKSKFQSSLIKKSYIWDSKFFKITDPKRETIKKTNSKNQSQICQLQIMEVDTQQDQLQNLHLQETFENEESVDEKVTKTTQFISKLLKSKQID